MSVVCCQVQLFGGWGAEPITRPELVPTAVCLSVFSKPQQRKALGPPAVKPWGKSATVCLFYAYVENLQRENYGLEELNGLCCICVCLYVFVKCVVDSSVCVTLYGRMIIEELIRKCSMKFTFPYAFIRI